MRNIGRGRRLVLGLTQGVISPPLNPLPPFAPLELVPEVVEDLADSLTAYTSLSGNLGRTDRAVGFHQARDRLPCGVQLLLSHGLECSSGP
jgi:hypothetical protein